MKRQTVRDERILAQRQKITSEAYSILMIALLVSLPLQQYIFKAPFEQYAVEFICFFGISAYVVIRNLTLGINLFGEAKNAKRTTLLSSVVTGITITAVSWVLGYSGYAGGDTQRLRAIVFTLAATFVCGTAGSFIVMLLLGFINDKRQKQIEKMLEDEEDA